METVVINVCDVKTFSRKSGRTGQTVIALNDKGYRQEYNACDLEDFDFSNCRGICEFDVGNFFIKVSKVYSVNGKVYYLSVPSYQLVKLISMKGD